jgi:hypothetical protein
MSRKFDRTRQIQLKAYEVLTDPEVIDMLFKRRPRWMPKFVWKIVTGLVIRNDKPKQFS